MTPAQMEATLDKVTGYTKASIQHAESLRRESSILDQRWAFDESRCTDSRCSSSRCSCQRRAR